MKKFEHPWPYLYIDNVLSPDQLAYYYDQAKQVGVDQGVGRKILTSDPIPETAALIDHFEIHRPYKQLGKLIHYAATAANLTHAMHVDAPFKIMTAVLYLGPDDNYGTRLYDQPDQPPVLEVEWKPNRLFVFCGTDYTWHDYRSKDTRYTLNYFLVDPTVIENAEYKRGVLT